ncbi:MAG TPA: hypothetical protein VE132_04835 [Micromonosporaceae bacterium]|nr:hypothetical protein [Micromonosporaceae bacterium]
MTSPAPLAGKLGLKPGRQAVVFNAPDGAIEALDPLPDGASVTAEAGETPVDVVAVFVRDAAEVESWVAKAAAAVGPGGRLWVVYPKGGKSVGTDINRDILHQRLGERGLTAVAMVSYDDRWSAMRLRTG